MFAGVPSRIPSHSSTSAAPAESAGRSVSSTSSTIATPSFTASSTAWSAGEGVWWTTSRRGTCASSRSVGGRVPAGTRAGAQGGAALGGAPGGGRVPGGTRWGARWDAALGGEPAGEVAVAHENADRVAEVHAVVALLQGVGEGRFAVGEEHVADAGGVADRAG